MPTLDYMSSRPRVPVRNWLIVAAAAIAAGLLVTQLWFSYSFISSYGGPLFMYKGYFIYLVIRDDPPSPLVYRWYPENLALTIAATIAVAGLVVVLAKFLLRTQKVNESPQQCRSTSQPIASSLPSK